MSVLPPSARRGNVAGFQAPFVLRGASFPSPSLSLLLLPANLRSCMFGVAAVILSLYELLR